MPTKGINGDLIRIALPIPQVACEWVTSTLRIIMGILERNGTTLAFPAVQEP